MQRTICGKKRDNSSVFYHETDIHFYQIHVRTFRQQFVNVTVFTEIRGAFLWVVLYVSVSLSLHCLKCDRVISPRHCHGRTTCDSHEVRTNKSACVSLPTLDFYGKFNRSTVKLYIVQLTQGKNYFKQIFLQSYHIFRSI